MISITRCVTVSVKKGCETQASPQSRNRYAPSRTKMLPWVKSSLLIVSGTGPAASSAHTCRTSGASARSRSYSSVRLTRRPLGDQRLVVSGRPAERRSNAPASTSRLRVGHGGDLQLGIERKGLLPVARVEIAVEDRAERLAGVAHEHAPVLVREKHLGDELRPPAGQDLDQAIFVGHFRRRLLEEERPLGRRDAQDGRPGPYPLLFDRPGHVDT